jgi:hypothetical protein
VPVFSNSWLDVAARPAMSFYMTSTAIFLKLSDRIG